MTFHHAVHKVNKKNPDTIDSIMSVIAILSPLSVLPQIIQIFSTKDVSGISLSTWIISIATSVAWLTYGFHHKDKIVVLNSCIGGTLCILIAAGVVIYR